ncbi:AI-2E family transporter [Pelagivirga sediminicola]|uniref:AI-2E family transporter n=1 Tax=Pelagivirga sediminicola TaxID=2170575 RepID=A0A2T7GBM7_9RHOB|nr:AI-2E family transporter [Pelagivirga sediminicola]PVA11819.1 AI-2E family transporter [Pelagivirga sediminicola]
MSAPKRIYVPLIGIFIIALVAALVSAANFLIPVTAAILSYFVFSRPRRALERLGMPSMLIATFFTSILFIITAIGIFWFAEPVATLIDDMPSLMRDMQGKLGESNSALAKVNEAAKAIDDAVGSGKEKTAMEVEVVSETSTSVTILTMAPKVLSQVIFAIFLTFFLIGSGDFFALRTVESLPKLRDKRRAVEIIKTIEDRLGRYLGGIALINAGLGLSIGAAMYLWELPNAIAIGVMAFTLNFIPFLGAVVGAGVAALVAFVSFEQAWEAFGVFMTYMALTSIEGQIVTPLLISRRMQLNTPILFLIVAFFAYIWSVVGMVVAVPVLIVVKIVCDEIEGLQALGHFLGDSSGPSALRKAKPGPTEPKATDP